MKQQTSSLGKLKNYLGVAMLFSAVVSGNVQAQTFAPYTILPFSPENYGGQVRPTLVDLDNDGDLDIMTTNNNGGFGALWAYYENTGTRRVPAFAAAPPALNTMGLSNNVGGTMTPSFVDIDNDGDMDMFVGAYSGTYFLENTGTASAPAFAAPISSPFGLNLFGYYETPAFADMDHDGDMDVLRGKNDGNFNYYLNTGSASAPAFTPQALPAGISNVGIGSRPLFLDMDNDGDQDLLVGLNGGDHIYFQNTGTIYAPTFAAAVTNPFGLSSTGNGYTGSAAGDLDFDGDLDVITGDQTNLVKYFGNTTPVPQPATPANSTPGQNLLVCNGTAATLMATGVPTGTLGWYDAATGGNYLGTGSPFTTMALTENTTFYVQDSTAGGASTAREVVAVTVAAPAAEQTLSHTGPAALCEHGISTFMLGSSVSGVSYTLRNDLNDTIVHGPVAGNGGMLFFTTADMTTAANYNVLARFVIGMGTECETEMAQKITVTVNQPVTNEVDVQLCYNADYTYADGTIAENVTEDQSHISTLEGQAANGCDSILTENIVVLPELLGVVTTTICNEEEIIINGTVYNASNPSGTEVFENIGIHGCDSTVTIDLNALPALTGNVTETLCAGEQITVNGTVYDLLNPTGIEVFTSIGANGCDSTVTINLSYNPAINTSIDVTGLTLHASQFSATYQWINCDDETNIEGATAQNFTATENGNYAVIVNWNGCEKISGCITITTVGIEELQEASIKLYPNPAGSTFTIAGLEAISDIRSINILDVNGKVVASADHAEAVWNISTIETGVYYVQIVHGKGIEMIRLIKQ
jgi:hypothetical protein